jgi:hypothetical protein
MAMEALIEALDGEEEEVYLGRRSFKSLSWAGCRVF